MTTTTIPEKDPGSQIAYLARVLKTPTIMRVFEDLAETARDQAWSHEEYLAALLATRGRLARCPRR